MTQPRDGMYRYALWSELSDWFALGWEFAYPVSAWGCAVFWPCDCKPKVPAK